MIFTDMGKAIVIILIAIYIMYILYTNGYLIIKAKRAVSFVGSMRGRKAYFSSCSGYIKRIVKFKEDKTYIFTLEAELTKGEMTAELLDSEKRVIICLNSYNKSAAAALEKGKRYCLILRFKSATGKYMLKWD